MIDDDYEATLVYVTRSSSDLELFVKHIIIRKFHFSYTWHSPSSPLPSSSSCVAARLPQYLPPLLFIIIYKIHSTSTYYYYATLAPTILVPFSESSSQKLNGSLLVLFFARLKIKFNDFPRWNIVDGGELNSQSWVVAQLGIHISLSLALSHFSSVLRAQSPSSCIRII